MLHSEICGSPCICHSPQLIAAYHVLRRLPVPRHSPCALLHLTFLRVLNSSLFENYSFFSFGFSTSATCSFLPKFLCSKNFTSLCFTSSIASYSVFKVLQGLITSLCDVVGSNGFEPSTSRLSGARSSLLSYEPISTGACLLGGDEEVRTLDLLRARQALSQLSYTPVLSSESPLKGLQN